MARGKKHDPYILTAAEEKTVQEYLKNGGDQSKAYRVGFPQANRWQNQAVWPASGRFFAQQKVKDRIAELMGEAKRETLVTVARNLEEAARMAYADPRRLYNEEGQLLPVQDWPAEVAAMVASIDHDPKTGAITKVKMWNKNAALDKLFRYKGMYEADNQQKAPMVNLIENLPAEKQALIMDKLRGIAGVDREPIDDRSPVTTH